MSSANHFDVIVLGAGAAGLMCAAEAGKRGRRVLLLEHNDRPGRKIIISGGGRCNFTNIHATAANYLSHNPHFIKSALARYRPRDFIALVEKHGIRYHEKTLGQLFCDDSAQQIVAMLERECRDHGVTLRSNTSVHAVRKTDAGFEVDTKHGAFTCASVVVATGGLSIPKLGATGLGYDLARQFGHTVLDPHAGLVPLVFGVNDRDTWCDLTGVSAEVIATIPQQGKAPAPKFREKALITHRGLSGPAILQISSYWRPGGDIVLDLAPNREVLTPLLAKNARRDANALYGVLKQIFPTRFAERWTEQAIVNPDWTNAGIARMEQRLHAWALRPDGTEGFAKAEVTLGGVDTRELDARTMQSLRAPGMYFIGEVVDVTGWLGGYNFQWAWASAVAAGQSA